MKTAYTFVTLRYVHDVVTGEFANVGIVLYAPDERYLEARFTTSYERLNALFVKIDHANYRSLDHGLNWQVIDGGVLDAWVGGAPVLTDDHAPVDQLLTPYTSPLR